MSVDPIGLLLLGGIAVIALGVIAGIVVLVVVLARRSRRAEPPSGVAASATGGIAALADSSPFATYQVPGAESSESNSLSGAFVAGPRRATPTEQGATGSESGVGGGDGGGAGVEGSGAAAESSGASSEAAAPLAPTVPAWHDIVGSPLDAEPFQYTTGSFAAPSPLAAAEFEPGSGSRSGVAEEAPLANPWAGTGPQDDSLPPRPAPAVVPEPASAPDPEPVVPRAPVSTPAITPPPGAIAPPPGRSEPPVVEEAPVSPPLTPQPVPLSAPEPAPEPEDDGPTVVIAGRGTAPAPWLLILDTGDRIGVEADSVVLGRRPAPIEHGVPGIVVPDPTKTLSKVHARLDRVGDQWTITDLGSTNGTAIIEAGGRERLLPAGGSDVVRGRFVLGEVGLVLVRNPEAVR